MTSKKVLLADANFSCLPILQALQITAHEVEVCGRLTNDPCHNLSQKSYPIDYSNTSELVETLASNKISYVVSGCNDASYAASCFAAEELGLPGYDCYETMLILHHKDKFRNLSEQHNYPVPKATTDLKKANQLEYPVLVKPVNSFSGRGISKAHTADELQNHVRLATEFSSSKEFVIEEFVEGSLHSHSAFIKNGKIVIDFFVDEFCTVYEYQVNSSCLSHSLSLEIKQNVRQWCETLASDLNLVDGLVHTQFIANDGRFWILEVTRRCPGDLYSELIRLSTGIEYAKLYAQPFIGEPLPDHFPQYEPKFIARHTASQQQPCILVSTSLSLPDATARFVSIVGAGTKIKGAPFGKSGIYFIEFSSVERLIQFTPNLKNYVHIDGYPIKDFS